jgi:ABC-2 type transport system permease protein
MAESEGSLVRQSRAPGPGRMYRRGPARTRASGIAEEGRLRSLVDFYVTTMRTSVIAQFQYRASHYLYMLGMIAEPVIYLVVWSSIARSHGGSVDGITAGQFAAYYIVWTLVRNMNVVFTPYGWEWRIREGEFSGMLLRPLHPIHQDIAFFAGMKVVVIVLWLPIAAALTVLFHPSLHPGFADILVFLVAIWGAYLIRTMFQSLLGMVTFWTTRVGAFFDLYFIGELLLSGRLVPLKLMPGWVQGLASYLPFKWTFYFPIEALVGNRSTESLLRGLGMQVMWIAIGAVLFQLVWKQAVKRYSAVSG